MAKVLITFLQPIVGNDHNNLICYYESLTKELERNNNEILLLNTIYEAKFPKQKQVSSWISSWIETVKNFKPDIIFAFNNRIFEEIIEVTDCPIILFEADLAEYFVKTELIKKYQDRYYIGTFCPKYTNKYLDLGFQKDHIINLNYATSVHREERAKTNNISFIGSCFNMKNKPLRQYLESFDDNRLYKMLLEFWQTQNYNYKYLTDKYYPGNTFSEVDYHRIFDSRIYTLQSILDLDLKLYGVDWDKLPQELLPIKGAFDKTPIYSLQHNQDIYNSSIINLSISHPQCEGYAFPWRIFDIMASGGLLISSYSSHLNEITDGNVNIPMFKTPYEARDLCKKFLSEENLRNDIISASNEFIEKFGRWDYNFEKIQQVINIKLLNNLTNGKAETISYDIPPQLFSPLKTRFKNFTNSLALASMEVPIIDKFYTAKNRKKVYDSLKKYNKKLREECSD